MNDAKIIALINAASSGGTGGGSTTLPIASSTTLGGVKVGSGIAVTSDGTISTTNTNAGTVTNVSSANADITVANGTTTPTLTLNSGTSANQILKVGSDGKLPAIDGSKVTGLTKTQVGLSNVDNVQQIPMSQKGVVNGVASLDASGKVPLSQTPVVSANVVAVANQTARLALPTSANLTIAIQADTSRVWGLNANLSSATLANWVDMGSSNSNVSSVNGATGAITVDKTTVGLNNLTNDKQVKALASSVDQDILVFSGTTGDTVADSGKKLPAGLVVGTTDVQTLVNKTLTNPVISTISNTGTITIPTSTDVLVGRATTDTLTNKTVLDGSFYIADDTDSTKKAQFDASGITTATTRTYGLPNKNGTIALSSDAANAPSWVLANSYRQYDLVTYSDGSIYQANATIPASTAWAIGTTGATWKQVGGNSNHIMKSANFTVDMGKSYAVDCSSSAITVSLPITASLNSGDTFRIFDIKSNSATNNITIDFTTASQQLKGVASNNFVLNTNGCYVVFVWDGASWQFAVLGNTSGATVPSDGTVGDVKMTARINAPDGWLICNGSAISRTTYAGLFAAIGTAYGVGDGNTTFNLPDLRGKVPVGYNSSDTDFNTLGKTGGEKVHTLTVNEMPSHNHGVSTYTGIGTQWISATSSQTYTAKYNTDNAGGGAAHNNMQPYITLNYIIKY